jgi:hypothetical protein
MYWVGRFCFRDDDDDDDVRAIVGLTVSCELRLFLQQACTSKYFVTL